jgi:ubiquinone/menaquinone biosynthesis C-methylase UbiE
MAKGAPDRMSDLAFRLMAAFMAAQDRLSSRIDRRIEGFHIQKGMTVVDYGCGPGRYTTRFAALVGEEGLVYAIDVQELALESVRCRMRDQGLSNIVPVLAVGYRTKIDDHVADMVFALDMIFGVNEPTSLLAELRRLCRQDGVLIVDDGHQRRERTLQMLRQSGEWTIEKESRDHLRCIPLRQDAA